MTDGPSSTSPISEVSDHVPYGDCPNCKTSIPLNSSECPKCRAAFSAGSAWAIAPNGEYGEPPLNPVLNTQEKRVKRTDVRATAYVLNSSVSGYESIMRLVNFGGATLLRDADIAITDTVLFLGTEEQSGGMTTIARVNVSEIESVTFIPNLITLGQQLQKPLFFAVPSAFLIWFLALSRAGYQLATGEGIIKLLGIFAIIFALILIVRVSHIAWGTLSGFVIRTVGGNTIEFLTREIGTKKVRVALESIGKSIETRLLKSASS